MYFLKNYSSYLTIGTIQLLRSHKLGGFLTSASAKLRKKASGEVQY